MRVPWKAVACLAIALTALLVASPLAAANHSGSAQSVTLGAVGESVTLGIDEWTGYTFTISQGETIAYSIQGGSDFDVYFVSPTGLSQYESHTTFQTYNAIENRMQFAGNWGGSVSGSVTVILDNANVSASGAMPTGSITISVSMSEAGGTPGTPFDPLAGIIAMGLIACAGIIIAIIVVIVLVIAVLTRRPKPPMPVMPPSAPPPQAPYGQAPPSQGSGGWPPPEQPPQGP